MNNTIRPSIRALFIAALAAGHAAAAPNQGSVLDLFPSSGLPSVSAETVCSFDYTPSGSQWTAGLDEKNVFLASIQGDGWRIGIGKGGHVYSLRGPFGELVPPQRIESPWNDEVWQFVITNEKLIGPIHEVQNADRSQRSATMPLMYFIHQAGIYVKGAGLDGGSAPAPFYSPCLRKRWNSETRTLEMVNWIQQARTPCVWRSGVLLYTAYRDLGRGMIEVNQVVHNFGTENLGHLNAPWGGVRFSSLPHTIISAADGSWEVTEGKWGWGGIPERELKDTGGWEAWVQNPKEESSPALALVFGQSHEDLGGNMPRHHYVRWGTAANVKVRDYQVTAQVSKVDLRPGNSLSARWYLIAGEFAQVRERAAQISEQARVTRIEFDAGPRQPVWIEEGRVVTEGTGKPWIQLHAFPVKNTVPLFLLTDKRTGEQIITADPYALAETEPFPNPLPADFKGRELYDNRVVYKQYLSHIGYENLLGFSATAAASSAGARLTLPAGASGIQLHESAQNLRIP